MSEMNSTTIIIIGATGDLATKNLLPALYELWVEKPDKKISIIGIAQDHITSAELLEKTRPFITCFEQKLWQQFTEHVSYLAGDVTKPQIYMDLSELVGLVEGSQLSQRILYSACPPQLFIQVVRNACAAKILHRQDYAILTRHIIVIEKPFGTDLQSAQELNTELTNLLNEHQIIRADHYLAKDLVETVAYLRFTNEIFEPLWNKEHIEYIILTLNESEDVQDRISLYNTLGVVKDVIQSHALQLLSLIAMESPASLHGKSLHREKLSVLKKTTITHAIFGQYIGYTEQIKNNHHSTTATYTLLTCNIDTPRWENVPFILQAGKALDKHSTSIKIVFKQPACKLTKCPLYHNELVIKLAPENELDLTINIKKPHVQTEKPIQHEITPVTLNFCYNCMWPYTPQAYRTIFENIMHGDYSISVPFEEIRASWNIIDSLNLEKQIPFYYEKGSSAPEEAHSYLNHLISKKEIS